MTEKLFGNFGFLNTPLVNISSNIFMPKNLFERVITSNNLFVVGNNKEEITGGGISLNKQEAEISAFGEFVERYSSSFQSEKGLILGSFDELCKVHKCYKPSEIKYYTEKQYKNDFKFKKLNNDTRIHWIKSKNYLNNEDILLHFLMTNVENIKNDGMFHVNTTTGTACHISIDKVIESGLMECIERDAFCKFWYLQKIKKYKKFSSKFILSQYPGDKKIFSLFNNKKVKIIVFDISEFGLCPTFVTFIYFKKRDRTYQSVGSATRLNHREALIKSCLKAYQGIEYIELVCNQNKFEKSEIENLNFKSIDSFRRHYALYNVHPELMDRVPIFKNMFNEKDYSNHWQDNYNHHLKNISINELTEKGLEEVYFTLLTTNDVKQFGLHVGKVITPKLHLLTGNFNYPYLGLFDEDLDLMLEMPHPFP